jgi:hypothetical protein
MRNVLLFLALSACVAAAIPERDLIVYGGTAGGVITAVSASRQGLSVTLLEPGQHVGGMATGGLSRTDFGKKEVIGGYPLEFYWRVGLKYDIGRYAQDVAWFYEPRVGEAVFREMLEQAHVEVLFGKRLREGSGVRKNGAQIVAVITEDGVTRPARAFADCSYEGDLMAQSGVTYTWGRESTSEYGESLAGVRDRTPKHQFLSQISPKDEKGNLLPEIYSGLRGKPGDADKKVQSYNFRMILSNDPANQVPFPKPPNYDAHRYELMARLLKASTERLGRAPVLQEVTLIAPIPNHKADFNNQGPFSTDYIGASWEYPNGNYAKRAEIWQAHIDYTKGYFYFLAHDPRVPQSLQKEVNEWGLAKDEYTDTDNWPNQLYIREARRMVGVYVLKQKDLQTELTKATPIGMASYNSDSHNIERIVNSEGFVENEGDMQVPVKPYQIPYEILLPKSNEATNLLVPVCFSASHVAYSSARMEPQYMIMGQAAGVAVALALKSGKPIQDIDKAKLVQILQEQGVVMEYRPTVIQSGFFYKLWSTFQPGASTRAQLP